MNTAPSSIPILLVVMFVLCGLVRLAEQEYRDRAFAELVHRYFGLRPLKKLFIALFLVVFCQRGGSKPTNSVPENGSGGTVTNSVVVEDPAIGGISAGVVTGGGINAGMGGSNTITGEQFYPPRLTTNQYRAGFAQVKATTDTAPWLAVPSNAVVHAQWTRYGVAEDTFWLPTNGWAFVLGTNAVDGAHISSSGTLSFGTPKGSPRAAGMPDGTDISFLAALQGSLGTVPPQGRFWHAPTPSNSLLCTWQDVCAGRDSNSVVSFQAELFWNGDFAYRYAFTNAPALTNFVIGAQHNGGGETWALSDTNRLVNGLELRWRAFGMLDPGVEDHDSDGLSTYDEVMLHGTNPALKDSDRDGLEDAAELAAGTNPLNPDTDGDGLADGIDPQPTVWNDTGVVIPNSGGLTYGRVILNGLDPATNWALDSDNDGWPDWKELMAGTSPTDPYSTPQNADDSCKLFDATFTLGADLPCPVVLNAGGYTLVLQKAGSWTLILKEGEAYNLTLTASQPCAVSLSCSLTSAFAALQDASGAFSGGAQLPGGVPTACGVIAQPTVCVTPEPPERVCFHSEAPKTVAAKVSPAMAGAYQWHWYGGGISSTSGKSANISWDGGDSYVYLSFTASGAAQPRFAYREVTKCSKVDDDTWCDDHGCEHWYCACDNADASDDDDCGFHGQKVSKCRAAICPTHHCPYDECPDGWCHQHDTWYSDCGEWWCHMHECYLSECNHDWYDPGHDPGEGGGGSAEEEEPDPDPGEPVFGSCDESLAAVNNDDDDASSAEDSGESPVAGENDLVAVWPLGFFDGQCCPCPEHHVPPDGSQSAELESCSTRLALWADAAKTSAQGDTVNAGQAVWVEGQNASTSVGADRIVWKWTDEENHVHRVTNAFTVLSVRLFGDVNLDGQVDAADKALHPLLSHEYGWGMPAATNVFHPVVLRTDVGLSGGVYTLALSGPSGMCRIWTTGSPASTNSPLLVCGQTVTNGVNGVYFLSGADSELYVEAVNGGTATLTYQYVGTGGAAGISCAAAMKMTSFHGRVLLDTSRDGSVDDSDEADKNAAVTFEGPKGAVILANADDDVADQTTQPDCTDNVINGNADLPDIYTLKIRKLGVPLESIPDGLSYMLKVENPPGEQEGAPAANSRVRIFRSLSNSAEGVIGPDLTDAIVFRKEPGEGELDIALLAGTGYLEMGIEGIEFGRQVSVKLATALNGNTISADSSRLLVAPFFALSNTDKATKCFLGPSWEDFCNETEAALEGVVPVETLGSAFVQDYGEIGYTRAAANQAQRKQAVAMGFDDLNQWYSGLVDSETGYFLYANEQQRNPGGNIECSPALPSYPFGRCIVGVNLAARAKEFLQAQKVQTDNGNLIELPVAWLRVGHVDEVMTIIPVGSGFKVLVADLQMAIDLLRNNPTNETWGGFSTRAEILAAYDANSNRVAEINNYLASVRDSLAQGLGVNESTFVKVPVAFTIASDEHVGTYLPNMVNMIVIKPASGLPKIVVPRSFFVPYADSIAARLGEAGFNGSGEFVDTSGPHSNGGEAHCASNVRRMAP